MMKRMLLCVLSMFPLALLAQEQQKPMGPPPILQIIREEVKPGKGMAHEKYESSWTQAFVHAKYTTPGIGMTAVTGSNEAWFLSGFADLAAFEADQKKLFTDPATKAVMQQYAPGDAEYIAGTRTVLARYRDDLSYNANIKLGEMRYFQVRTVRVRTGHDGEYAELRKIINAAREKSNSQVHSAVFQVITGAPNGTYLIFSAMKSLGENEAAGGGNLAAAMGTDGEAKVNDLVGKSIMSSEDAIYAFSPGMSIPSPDMVAQDAGFWKPKAAASTSASKGAGPAPAKKAPEKK